jgi:hypothetical protein
VTPGITPLCSSLIVPEIELLSNCATAGAAQASSSTSVQATFLHFFMASSSRSFNDVQR